MNLPAADNSYDCVVCVESSHCYPDIDKFLAEVKRVLKPGGTFLFADFRDEQLAELPVLMQQLERSGMDMLKTVDITPNVVEALNNDHKRKVGELCHCPLALRRTNHFLSRWRTASRWCHKFCKGLSRCMPSPCAFARSSRLNFFILQMFIGTKGSRTYNCFVNRHWIYSYFVLQKPE
jgi:SAM-dependent methyltransferase